MVDLVWNWQIKPFARIFYTQIYILSVYLLGGLAFSILLKIPPQADVEAEKIRLELTEMEKTDENRKKEATRESSLKNSTKTEKQKKSKEEPQKKSPKKERPSKQRAQVIAKQELVSEEEEEEAVYVANVPVQKNAFLAVVSPDSLWLKARLGKN